MSDDFEIIEKSETKYVDGIMYCITIVYPHPNIEYRLITEKVFTFVKF